MERALSCFATGALSVAANTTGQVITFTDQASIQAENVLVKNAGAATVFMGQGGAQAVVPVNAATPLPNQTPILPGEIDLYYKGMGVATISFNAGAGPNQVYATACRSKT